MSHRAPCTCRGRRGCAVCRAAEQPVRERQHFHRTPRPTWRYPVGYHYRPRREKATDA